MSDQELGPPRSDQALEERSGRSAVLKMRLDAAITAQGRVGTKAKERGRLALVLFLVFLPSLVALAYFGLIVTQRYVSEAVFVVKTASKTNGVGGLTSFLQMTGMARAQDDTFAVHEFIESRDGLEKLAAKLPLREMFGREEADFIAVYPSVFYGSSQEDFFDYFRGMIHIRYSSNTGITKFQVEAFRPEDARVIALTLLDLGEVLVNDLNDKIHSNAVSYAEQDVAEAQDRVIHSQALVTAYRNKELEIDPEASALTLSELSGQLSAELAALQARIAELQASAPNSPLLPGLRDRMAAIKAQIDKENARIREGTDGDPGLAQKLSDYERLMIAHEFAAEDLGRAMAGLEVARREGRRQQLFLERIVEPSLPDAPGEPKRLQTILAILVGNLIALMVGWFIWVGIREHGATMS